VKPQRVQPPRLRIIDHTNQGITDMNSITSVNPDCNPDDNCVDCAIFAAIDTAHAAHPDSDLSAMTHFVMSALNAAFDHSFCDLHHSQAEIEDLILACVTTALPGALERWATPKGLLS